MKPILLIKIGGSVITDKNKPYTENRFLIKKIAKEISKIKKPLIIVHGSGSFGHTSATKYGGKKGYESKWGVAKVSFDAKWINQIVMEVFIEEKLPVISLSPMSMIIASGGKLSEKFFQVVEILLNQGLIPVVYGDVIWDKKWESTIFSGEKTLNEIAKYLIKNHYSIEKMIQLGSTKGVYDKNGKSIKIITQKDWSKIKRSFIQNNKIDVTGGMKHKVKNALELTRWNIETWIIHENNFSEAIEKGEITGTIIR